MYPLESVPGPHSTCELKIDPLNMLHTSQAPGASVLLVCSHANTELNSPNLLEHLDEVYAEVRYLKSLNGISEPLNRISGKKLLSPVEITMLNKLIFHIDSSCFVAMVGHLLLSRRYLDHVFQVTKQLVNLNKTTKAQVKSLKERLENTRTRIRERQDRLSQVIGDEASMMEKDSELDGLQEELEAGNYR